MALIVPVASFKTTLTQRLAAAGTTAYIDTTTDDSGNDLDGQIIAVTINKGDSALEETILGTVDTATSSLTSISRNLDVSDGTTTGTGKDHRKKSPVEITSFPYLTRAIRAINGTDQLDADNIMEYDANPSFTADNEIITKKYADDLAIAGAPDGAEAVKGIYELATNVESAAGTDSGSTSAVLVVRPSDIGFDNQNQSHTYAADTGAADAYAIALTPAVSAYAAGQKFCFLATNANTGASTLDVNSLGVKTILKLNDKALEANDIEAGQIIEVVYNGTEFELQTPLGTGLTTAQTAEIAAIVDATDVSGAELETLTDGSNADDLHEHSAFEQIAIAAANNEGVFIVQPGDTDFWTEAGNGSTTQRLVTTFNSGAAATNARSSSMSTGATGAYVATGKWDAAFKLLGEFALRYNTSQDVFFGFGDEASGGSVTGNATSTDRHIGFFVEDGTLYASNADGTTQTRTDITGALTLTEAHAYRIDWNPGGTNIKYYVDGNLLATHSTNLPGASSVDHNLQFGIGTQVAAAREIYWLSTIYVEMELK